MASPQHFVHQVSPTLQEQELLTPDQSNSEGESNLDSPFFTRQRDDKFGDSGIQTSTEVSHSFHSEEAKDAGVPDFHSRTSSISSGPHPSSNHVSSEYSTDTDGQEMGGRGHYKLSAEEKQKRRKSDTERNLAAAADILLLAGEYSYAWSISNPQRRTQDKKLGSERYKQRMMMMVMDFKLLPDCTESDGKRMAKLKIKINLENVNHQENSFIAYINTTLYDPQTKSALKQNKQKFIFADGKNTIKFLMNLGRQELVEKSKSKELEIRVEVKVYGTSKIKNPDKDKYKCTEVDDGFTNIVEY